MPKKKKKKKRKTKAQLEEERIDMIRAHRIAYDMPDCGIRR